MPMTDVTKDNQQETNEKNEPIDWDNFFAMFKQLDKSQTITDTQIHIFYKKYCKHPDKNWIGWINNIVRMFE